MARQAVGTARIIRADARELPLADDSVDLVVTSPPYFGLRSYQDGGEHYQGQIGDEATPAEFVDALLAVTRECMRVLKPTGSLWVNLGDKYSGAQAQNFGGESRAGASAKVWQQTNPKNTGIPAKSLMGIPWRYALRCIDDLGLILRAEVIWSKPNGLPESVTDRVRRSHEQWFHLTLQPRYYSAVDEVREQYAPGTAERHASGYKLSGAAAAGQTANGVLRRDGGGPRDTNPLGKLPGSVWTVPTQPLKVPDHLGVDHFAAFPMEWPRRIIRGWSPAEVCSACGEGRRPVVERTGRFVSSYGNDEPTHSLVRAYADRQERQVNGKGGNHFGKHESVVTGYACACPDTTAPATPGVVLDPFGGTGTAVLVAKALGRTGIATDLSADYCRLAEWRVNDPKQLAQAAQAEFVPPAPQLDGQLGMFGEAS